MFMTREGTRSLLIKILTIIGFSATLLFIVWVLLYAVAHTPSIFTKLADIVREKEELSTSQEKPSEQETPVNGIPENQNNNTTPPAHTPKKANTTYVAPTTPYIHTLPSYADIAATIHGIGTYDTRGAFHYTETYDAKADMYVLVEMVNNGGRDSGSWTFEVSAHGHVLYTSSPQAPLRAREHIVFPIPVDFYSRNSQITFEVIAKVSNDAYIGNNGDTLTRNVR